MTLSGIDVSNNNPDPLQVPPGTALLFHKCTEGLGFRDPLYAARRRQAAAAGLTFGAYHFAHAENSPEAEADFFLATAGLRTGDLYALDLETTRGQTYARCADYAARFLARCRAATGRPGLLYSFTSFLKDLPTAGLVGYPLWVADPDAHSAGRPQPYTDRWPTWTLWQTGFTAAGLDADLFNGSPADLQTLGGAQPAPAAPAPPAAAPTPTPEGVALPATQVVQTFSVPDPVVCTLGAPSGGAWLLTLPGNVYAVGGAPYLGAPAGHAYWGARRAASLELAAGSGYVVVDTAGERYGPTF